MEGDGLDGYDDIVVTGALRALSVYTRPSDLQEFIDAELAGEASASRDEPIADAVRQLHRRKEQIAGTSGLF